MSERDLETELGLPMLREFHAMLKELYARRESMAWARDKLRKLKKNLEYCAAACKDIEMALDDSNPKLKKGAKL